MKVLIVDDEFIIRDGMAHVLPWEEHNYMILEPASSGEEAFERIKREQPDIIITDIMMQGMSGLELIDCLVDEPYPKEIIILSGYDEFDYVQEALRQNVSDYLLKTSTPEEILLAVNRARERLLETKQYLQFIESKDEQKINRRLKKFLFGPLEKEKYNDFMNETPELVAQAYQLFIIDDVTDDHGFFEGQTLWNTYLDGKWLIHREKTMIITKRFANLSDNYVLQMALRKIYNMYNQPIYASHIFTSLNELSVAYEQIKSLFLYHWLMPNHTIIQADDVKDREGISHLEKYEKHEDQLLKTIRFGDHDELKVWIESFINWIFNHPKATPKSIESYIQHLYFSIVRYMETIYGLDNVTVTKLPVSNQLFIYPVDTLFKLFHGLQTKVTRERGPDKYVNEALLYIEKYLAKSITLQDVANHVHVHPNYLSEMLRKKMGRSYLEILTEKRIKHAVNYLINTDRRIKEIAVLVGYNDRRYFTEVFKKYKGLTPSHYREKHSQEQKQVGNMKEMDKSDNSPPASLQLPPV